MSERRRHDDAWVDYLTVIPKPLMLAWLRSWRRLRGTA